MSPAGGASSARAARPAADGATVDEALDEMVEAMREYADDWTERLLTAPNHARNWDLVQLIDLSHDDQLRNPGRFVEHRAPTRTPPPEVLASWKGRHRVRDGRGRSGTHHLTYELLLPDGRLLQTLSAPS